MACTLHVHANWCVVGHTADCIADPTDTTTAPTGKAMHNQQSTQLQAAAGLEYATGESSRWEDFRGEDRDLVP